MSINTAEFNSKPGEIIPIDDIDVEREILPYIYNEKESRIVEKIWMLQNADYLKKQKEIKKKKKRDLKNEIKSELKNGVKKKPRQNAITRPSQIDPLSESCATQNVKGEIEDA